MMNSYYVSEGTNIKGKNIQDEKAQYIKEGHCVPVNTVEENFLVQA